MASRRTLAGIAGAMLALVVLGAPLAAVAEECRDACVAVASTAVREGKAALRSCKLSCTRDADPSSCRQTCGASLRQARTRVRAALVGCKESCRPANACEEQCFVPARQCLAPIIEEAKSCAAGCAASAGDAARACVDAADPFVCVSAAADQLQACIQGCAVTARDNAAACKSGLDACKTACAPANPCEGGCAPALHACVEPIVTAARTCGGGCVAEAREAGAACVNDVDPPACFARVIQELGVCALGCASSAEQGARTCRETFEDCVHECLPPNPCRDTCYGTLKQCVAPIAGVTRDCGVQCGAEAIAAGGACFGTENPSACLLQVDQALSACAHACADVARAEALECWYGFRNCAGTCEPPGDGTCRGACLGSAGECAAPYVGAGIRCARACAITAGQQGPGCLDDPSPAACFEALGQEVLACSAGCKATAEAGVQQCGGGLDMCVDACPVDACRDQCVGSLVGCIGPAAQEAEACAAACVPATVAGAQACTTSPTPLLCLGAVATGAAECAEVCLSAGRTDGVGCWVAYRECDGSCAP